MTPEEWVLSAPTILTVAGLAFYVYNNGQHIVVTVLDADSKPHQYHLWPSTGKWRYYSPISHRWGSSSEDGHTIRYRGVRGLIRYIQRQMS